VRTSCRATSAASRSFDLLRLLTGPSLSGHAGALYQDYRHRPARSTPLQSWFSQWMMWSTPFTDTLANAVQGLVRQGASR
jgi:hypothetical protein